MDTFEADSVHFLLLIDNGRARNAAAWYQQAFGAQLLHSQSNITGILNGLRVQSVFYLQLGPPGMGVVLEIRDSDSPKGLNNSNARYVLTSNRVPELIESISNLAPIAKVEAQVVNQCYHVTDPYGFGWIIQSLHMLPDSVTSHYPDLMAAAALEENVCLAHLLLLVPHPTAITASNYYRKAFGTAVVGPSIGISSIFMHLGRKRQLLEIKDSHQISNPLPSSKKSMCILHSTNCQNLVAQTTQAGALEIMTERDVNLQISTLEDNFGFPWMIGSMSLIPAILNEV